MGKHMKLEEVSAIQQLRLTFKGPGFLHAAQKMIRRKRRHQKRPTTPSKSAISRAVRRTVGKAERRGAKEKLTRRQKEALVNAAENMTRKFPEQEISAAMIKKKAFRGKKRCSDETVRRALREYHVKPRKPRKQLDLTPRHRKQRRQF
jgi:hypothetical protein